MNKIFAIASVGIKELYRRKDFYVLFVLSAVITIMAGTASFFHDDRMGRYLAEICLLLVWISMLVIAIAMASRQIPAEREQRTIFPLLAKPVSRGQVIVGKFLGCWLAAGIALAVFYLFLGVETGAREHQWPGVIYYQAFLMQWVMLAVVIAMTVLGSVVFAAPSSTFTIIFVVVGGILTVGMYLNRVALQNPEPWQSVIYTLYFIIPHLEFFDLHELVVHQQPAVSWLAMGAAILYAAAYTAVFLFGAWTLFRRKAL
jgi:ABC-type transport system involved in multi-copper enzyme maturation permease subunit